jgi:hypothetical protein
LYKRSFSIIRSSGIGSSTKIVPVGSIEIATAVGIPAHRTRLKLQVDALDDRRRAEDEDHQQHPGEVEQRVMLSRRPRRCAASSS